MAIVIIMVMVIMQEIIPIIPIIFNIENNPFILEERFMRFHELLVSIIESFNKLLFRGQYL